LGIHINQSDFYEEFPFVAETVVDSAISACWFFRKELCDDIGYLDEKIFYSPEDLDYCLRVYLSGKINVYHPYFEVLHHTQQISHRKPFSMVSFSHFAGLLYYYKKHGGWVYRILR
jgi:GT2 family glycosyltransferase